MPGGLSTGQFGNDAPHLGTRMIEPLAGIDHEIGLPALLGVGNLPGEHGGKFFFGHAGSRQHTRALNLLGGADDGDAVDPRASSGLVPNQRSKPGTA